ncbi:hypothetical protein HMPREF9624_01543 [Oribacterium asaccharolyticum ACB7]|uniref:Uncharacterized protein n=1 Tax=Oribacterium asaccharolyticum ACB7 TaxID=796944 RepID=G9WWU9_9FIRM|nr:hypothetical protein [Oribacterium asaccharolyticum]EHL09502.1 hypothetical protein HMPREF9624_01543 [Oribacterium asaccharolyticum ACB7]
MKDKRNKRNRVDEEANFIGDVVRLLFALSIAVVTVVAGFILFKNISGFSLPNLKETEASTEQTKDAVVITEAAKETKKESREETTEQTEESKETESTKESTTESETKKESSTAKENGVVGESPTAATKKAESTKAETSSGKAPSDHVAIGEAPNAADGDVVEEGPGVH